MDLLEPIEVLVAQLQAEVAVLQARLKTIVAAVNQRAQQAGVPMPQGSPAPLRPPPVVGQLPEEPQQQPEYEEQYEPEEAPLPPIPPPQRPPQRPLPQQQPQQQQPRQQQQQLQRHQQQVAQRTVPQGDGTVVRQSSPHGQPMRIQRRRNNQIPL